ncbi:MAG: SBBP repeat-containing protein [Acidobacteriaceae bacterium]
MKLHSAHLHLPARTSQASPASRARRFCAVAAPLGAALTLLLSGCGGGSYVGRPSSTVVFTKASTQQWLHEFGTGTVSKGDDQGDTLVGVATDLQGDAIAAGFTTGAFSGFSNPNGVPQDFVAKFDPAGSQLWLQQFGTGSGDQLAGVAVDTQGNIAAAGVTNGAFPGFANPNHRMQAMVEKLDSSGHQLWLQQFHLNNSTAIDAIAVDSQGNVLVCGQVSPSPYPYHVHPFPYSPQQPVNLFVEKLNGGTGAEEWVQQIGNENATDTVSGLAVDSQGNPVLVGTSSGTFPGTMNPPELNPSLPFVLKLSSTTGQTLWVQQSSTPYTSPGYVFNAVAIDGQDNVVADGEGGQCLVFKFSGTTGGPIWTQNFGGAQQCLAGGLALDTDGSILVGGYASGAFLPSFTAMTDDIFLAKFTPAGHAVSIQQFGTGKEIAEEDSGVSSSISVATDAQNDTFVGGMTVGAFPGSSNTTGAQEIFLGKFGPQ